jgi:hypothetical protein
LLTVATLPLSLPAGAQDTYVPLSEEPGHVQMLINDVVRAVYLVVPPGESTLYHEHTTDIATVTLEGTELENQIWMQEPTVTQRNAGRVAFSGYGAEPYIHRVGNVGDGTFRIVAVEIFSPPDPEFAGAGGRQMPYELALENDRVRIWRIALEPAQSNALFRIGLPTVRIVQIGGTLAERVDRGMLQSRPVMQGNIQWLPAGTSVSVSNVGQTEVVIYDMEIK